MDKEEVILDIMHVTFCCWTHNFHSYWPNL